MFQEKSKCYVLALQSCNGKSFSIHGLWATPPTKIQTKLPCKLDIISIKKLWKDLDDYHRDCFGNNMKFLEYQWCKHGQYVFKTPLEYFQLSLKAYHFVLKKVGNRINRVMHIRNNEIEIYSSRYPNPKLQLIVWLFDYRQRLHSDKPVTFVQQGPVEAEPADNRANRILENPL